MYNTPYSVSYEDVMENSIFIFFVYFDAWCPSKECYGTSIPIVMASTGQCHKLPDAMRHNSYAESLHHDDGI